MVQAFASSVVDPDPNPERIGVTRTYNTVVQAFASIVVDPDPNPDPHVFGPPGSGFISQRYKSGSGFGSGSGYFGPPGSGFISQRYKSGSGFGSGSGSFYHHANIERRL